MSSPKKSCPICDLPPGAQITGDHALLVGMRWLVAQKTKIRGYTGLAKFLEALKLAGETDVRFNEPWPVPQRKSSTAINETKRLNWHGTRAFKNAKKNLGIKLCPKHQLEFDLARKPQPKTGNITTKRKKSKTETLPKEKWDTLAAKDPRESP